jgi:hypothetical protein
MATLPLTMTPSLRAASVILPNSASDSFMVRLTFFLLWAWLAESTRFISFMPQFLALW